MCTVIQNKQKPVEFLLWNTTDYNFFACVSSVLQFCEFIAINCQLSTESTSDASLQMLEYFRIYTG